jgi:hypothetical protein
MKKSQNSLLDKLKKENQANSKSSDILSDMKSLMPNLKTSTLLTRKIDEIKTLQKENRLDSSNEIFRILNTDFNYSYPFYYNVGNQKYQLSKADLDLSDNLKNHIKRESELNSVKNIFSETISQIEKKNKLDKIEISSQGYTAGVVLAILGIPLAYLFLITVYNNHDQSNRSALNTLIGSGGMLFGYFTFILFPIIGFKLGTRLVTNKEEKKQLANRIDKNLSLLKTKANNAYKT